MRSPSASAALRLGAQTTIALAAALDRAQQPRALARLDVLEPLEDERAVLERRDQRRLGHRLGDVELADVRDDERAAVGLGRRAPRRPGRRARRAASSGARASPASAATASSRPGSWSGCATMRSLPPAGGSSMPTPSRCAASRSESLIGRSASGVCASPASRIAPFARSGASRSNAIITSAAETPSPRQQVADEPRARELARDVVLQVGVQAAVARVELRRGADREHGGVEQVEPERRARPARAGRRRRRPSRRGVSSSARSSEM